MLIIYAIFLLGTGAAIGYCAARGGQRKTSEGVTLDKETFTYLVERDNELWEIEKTERSRLRYISPKLQSVAAENNESEPYIFMN